MRLLVVPFGSVSPGFLEEYLARLARVVHFGVEPSPPALDPAPAYDAEREQYNSTELLAMLVDSGRARTGDRILGVADVDLFVPILTFVFGEAQLEGPAAVFSLTRLDPAFYGLPADEDLLMERAVKEGLHELGHTFRLLHCRRADCVMRASTDAGEVDVKPAAFCRSCARALPRR